MDNPAADEIEQRGENNQAEKPPVPEAVKKVAGYEQGAVLQALATAKIQSGDNEEEDPKLDGIENDTLSPRFGEVLVIPDYTFRNRDEAGVEQGGIFSLERSLLLANERPSFCLGLRCLFLNFCHL